MDFLQMMKTNSNKEKFLALTLRFNIFNDIDTDELIKRIEKSENFFKKYYDLPLDKMIEKFKDEFKEEIEKVKPGENTEVKTNIKIDSLELSILKELIQKIYTKHKNIILDELNEINLQGQEIINNLIKNVDKNSIKKPIRKGQNTITRQQQIKENIDRKIKKTEEKEKTTEENVEEVTDLEIQIDNLDFNDEYEIKEFLNKEKNITKVKEIYEKEIQDKIPNFIKEKIEKLGIEKYIKDTLHIDKAFMLTIKYFENNQEKDLLNEFLQFTLKDARFRDTFINQIREYIDLEALKETLIIDDIQINNIKYDFSEYEFNKDIFKNIFKISEYNDTEIFKGLAEYYSRNNVEIKDKFFELINHFEYKEKIKEIHSNYYTFEETKNRKPI